MNTSTSQTCRPAPVDAERAMPVRHPASLPRPRCVSADPPGCRHLVIGWGPRRPQEGHAMQPTTDRPDHDDAPGPDVEAREEALWREALALLAARDHPKWASLSWIALRPLISSLNDRANAIAPQLVTDLRRAWIRRSVRREQLLGLDVGEPGVYQGIVDRSQDDCFLLLGDTGEQDASQYVVVPAL